MGLQVFLNCAGFIRIEPSEVNNDKYEVLDGTRIHPETYDWPRKMAIDALEYDDVRCINFCLIPLHAWNADTKTNFLKFICAFYESEFISKICASILLNS